MQVTKKIVNNESSEIVAFFNSEFNEFAEHPEVNLIPEDLKAKMDDVDHLMYNCACRLHCQIFRSVTLPPLAAINNGVYRCGFATSQAACALPPYVNTFLLQRLR